VRPLVDDARLECGATEQGREARGTSHDPQGAARAHALPRSPAEGHNHDAPSAM
jgi:hypothetical protein